MTTATQPEPSHVDTAIEPHRWYSVQVVARLLSLTDECIRQRCKAGTLPAARIPTDGGQGQWRIKGEDVLQLLGQMELARGGSGIVERPKPQRSPMEVLKRLHKKLQDRQRARRQRPRR